MKMTTSPGKSWKVLEICFDHVIFTISIACGTACKAHSKNKVIVDLAAGYIKCGLGSPGKMYLSPGKVLEICF